MENTEKCLYCPSNLNEYPAKPKNLTLKTKIMQFMATVVRCAIPDEHEASESVCAFCYSFYEYIYGSITVYHEMSRETNSDPNLKFPKRPQNRNHRNKSNQNRSNTRRTQTLVTEQISQNQPQNAAQIRDNFDSHCIDNADIVYNQSDSNGNGQNQSLNNELQLTFGNTWSINGNESAQVPNSQCSDSKIEERPAKRKRTPIQNCPFEQAKENSIHNITDYMVRPFRELRSGYYLMHVNRKASIEERDFILKNMPNSIKYISR